MHPWIPKCIQGFYFCLWDIFLKDGAGFGKKKGLGLQRGKENKTYENDFTGRKRPGSRGRAESAAPHGLPCSGTGGEAPVPGDKAGYWTGD